MIKSAFACCAAVATLALAATPQDGTRTIWDGIYSDAQARRGEGVYKRACGYCHRDDLSGGFSDNGAGRAPALSGPRAFDSSFAERWKDMTMADLIATVAATMPEQEPASLTAESYVDVVCYLLSKNDVPAGTADLGTDIDTLQRIRIDPRR